MILGLGKDLLICRQRIVLSIESFITYMWNVFMIKELNEIFFLINFLSNINSFSVVYTYLANFGWIHELSEQILKHNFVRNFIK